MTDQQVREDQITEITDRIFRRRGEVIRQRQEEANRQTERMIRQNRTDASECLQCAGVLTTIPFLIGLATGGLTGTAIGAGVGCGVTTPCSMYGLYNLAGNLSREQREQIAQILEAQGVPEPIIQHFRVRTETNPSPTIGILEGTNQQVIVLNPDQAPEPQTMTTTNPLFRNNPSRRDSSGMVVEDPFGQLFNLETGEYFKKGGFVKRTGLAYVHRGEYVVPVNKIKKCNVCK